MIKYFRGSFVFAVIGLISSFLIGFFYTGLWSKSFEYLFIATILAVLEVSLSFDNAIVNAKVLKDMSSVWRHRFLTWGMLIAVFGMRLVFPLVIVAVVASISPWAALKMAIFDPQLYAETMLSSHAAVAAFGGSFLLLVALEFFYDENKELHWIGFLEKHLAKWGHIEALEIFFSLLFLFVILNFVPENDKMSFLKSGMAGVLTFIAVKAIGQVLEMSAEGIQQIQRAGVSGFIYLEVLDASFSFDGVVGAFAITHNLLIIMIGLSIGAFFVRSLTILFVEKEVLNRFEYLEHGAFYAIGLLALLMILDPLLHVPEWFTGLSGAVIICTSLWWSLRRSKSI